MTVFAVPLPFNLHIGAHHPIDADNFFQRFLKLLLVADTSYAN